MAKARGMRLSFLVIDREYSLHPVLSSMQYPGNYNTILQYSTTSNLSVYLNRRSNTGNCYINNNILHIIFRTTLNIASAWPAKNFSSTGETKQTAFTSILIRKNSKGAFANAKEVVGTYRCYCVNGSLTTATFAANPKKWFGATVEYQEC